MGNDGGSIPKRHELVTLKAKGERADKTQVSAAVWTTCALSLEPLEPPVVVCRLGRLFNKAALLEALVARTSGSSSSEASSEAAAEHIASLRDVLTLRLAPNAAFERAPPGAAKDAYAGARASRWLCPVTLKEFSPRGNTQFAAAFPCGCVVAREAVAKVGTASECLVCGKECEALWFINPSSTEEIERMKVDVETTRIARLEAAAIKKAAKKEKKGEKDGTSTTGKKRKDHLDSSEHDDAKSKAKKQATAATSSARANIGITLPSDLESRTSSASLSEGHSDAIKSLYAKNKDKPKGNYLTMGTFNRYTSF
ncbi:Rtf2 RING-finger-domain-containing protein [Obelidium mucronatum]|nr:Rtf2 RING-finger-domain-containing protein [Obelidium mucronatum]